MFEGRKNKLKVVYSASQKDKVGNWAQTGLKLGRSCFMPCLAVQWGLHCFAPNNTESLHVSFPPLVEEERDLEGCQIFMIFSYFS